MSTNDELSQRLTRAYAEILEHAHDALEQAREETLPNLRSLLEVARKKAVHVGQVSRDDAEKVAEYIHRDIVHAAVYLESGQRNLSDWLRFDIQKIERRGAQVLATMVDHTRETLDDLANTADSLGWKTGEVVGPGTLHCKNCGQALHFHEAGHIPPCPKCHHAMFARDHDVS